MAREQLHRSGSVTNRRNTVNIAQIWPTLPLFAFLFVRQIAPRNFVSAAMVWESKASRCTRIVTHGLNGQDVRYPERFAQLALGHNSKAVHRAYARNAQVTVPPPKNMNDSGGPEGHPNSSQKATFATDTPQEQRTV